MKFAVYILHDICLKSPEWLFFRILEIVNLYTVFRLFLQGSVISYCFPTKPLFSHNDSLKEIPHYKTLIGFPFSFYVKCELTEVNICLGGSNAVPRVTLVGSLLTVSVRVCAIMPCVFTCQVDLHRCIMWQEGILPGTLLLATWLSRWNMIRLLTWHWRAVLSNRQELDKHREVMRFSGSLQVPRLGSIPNWYPKRIILESFSVMDVRGAMRC